MSKPAEPVTNRNHINSNINASSVCNTETFWSNKLGEIFLGGVVIGQRRMTDILFYRNATPVSSQFVQIASNPEFRGDVVLRKNSLKQFMQNPSGGAAAPFAKTFGWVVFGDCSAARLRFGFDVCSTPHYFFAKSRLIVLGTAERGKYEVTI